MSRLLACLGAGLVAACFSLDRPAQLQVLCGADADCPSGLVCARGGEAGGGCCVSSEAAAELAGGNPAGLVCRSWCADPRLRKTETGACLPSFAALAAADASTCGLLTAASGVEGAVYCWGAAADPVTAWYRSANGPQLSKVDAEGGILCGLEARGHALQCWNLASPEPVGLLDADARKADFADLSMAADHVCGLTADGVAVCLPLPGATSVPAGPAEPPKWRSLSAGAGVDCALDTGGNVACWPALPEGLVVTTAELLARSATAGCLVTAGDLRCWAEAEAGKPLVQSVQPEAGVPVGAVAVGDELVCVLPVDVAARPASCWAPAAPAVPQTTGLRSLVVGKAHACALKADGSAVCWGANASGQAPGTVPETP